MDLRSRLPAIISELQSQTRGASEEVAEDIVKDAQSRVPVRTGGLRDAIHWEPDAEGWRIVAGDEDHFYGHIVEFGSSSSARASVPDSGRRGGGRAALGLLQAALCEPRSGVVAAMSKNIRQALYGKMAGDSTLTAMLGTASAGYAQSIYYQQAPSDAQFPYVVFFQSSGTPNYTFKVGPRADGQRAVDDQGRGPGSRARTRPTTSPLAWMRC